MSDDQNPQVPPPPAQPPYIPPAQPQYAPAPQGYNVYAQAAYVSAPEPRGLSITSLVLGLVSIVFGFTFFVPAGAIVFGIIGLKKESAGKGMSITGIVLGGVCLLGWVLVTIAFFAVFAALFGIAASTGYASYAVN